MKYSLLVTELAEEDLDAIVHYIIQELSAPDAAGAFLDDVAQCYGRLIDNPEIYALCADGYLSAKGYRRAVIRHYVLIYKVDASRRQVIVMRLFYGARDYEKFLK